MSETLVFVLLSVFLFSLRMDGQEAQIDMPPATREAVENTSRAPRAVSAGNRPSEGTSLGRPGQKAPVLHVRDPKVQGCDPTDASLEWLTSSDGALLELPIGNSLAFENICVPPTGVNTDLIIRDFGPSSTNPRPQDSYWFRKLSCQRVTAARLVCTVDQSPGGASPNAWDIQSFYFPSVQMGTQPCASWLTPESHKIYTAACDTPPEGGLFEFDVLAPIGGSCRMNLCQHEVFKEWLFKPYWGYALGFDPSCCTHANFSEWAVTGTERQWTCQLRSSPKSAISLDCRGADTAKDWSLFGQWCSVFNSIPITPSSCWNWAPDMSKAPYPVCPPGDLTDSGCGTSESHLLCCPRYVAYGTAAQNDSEIYALQPFGLCNVSGSGKARYIVETTPGSLFKLSLPNPDPKVPYNWYCEEGNTPSDIKNWSISWDPNQDGAITNACLSPNPSSGPGFITFDSNQDYACKATGCSSVGFNPGIHVFRISAPNGPGGKFAGALESLGYLTVQGLCLSNSPEDACQRYSESPDALKRMADPLLTFLESHLPVRGAPHISCGPWVSFFEALLDPNLCQSLSNLNKAKFCSFF